MALGTKGLGYTVHVSDEQVTGSTLIDEIPKELVAMLLKDLVQEGHVINARAVHSLLKGDVTFRLKKVAQDLHLVLMRDIAKLPRDHRHVIGQELRDCMSRVLRNVFSYSLADNRPRLLASLSGELDLLKYLLQEVHSLSLFDGEKFAHRAGLAVEVGNITGGLLRKAA